VPSRWKGRRCSVDGWDPRPKVVDCDFTTPANPCWSSNRRLAAGKSPAGSPRTGGLPEGPRRGSIGTPDPDDGQNESPTTAVRWQGVPVPGSQEILSPAVAGEDPSSPRTPAQWRVRCGNRSAASLRSVLPKDKPSWPRASRIHLLQTAAVVRQRNVLA